MGILPVIHPTARGSRIALIVETDNAEAHAIGIYCSLRGMSHIYDNPRLVIIYHPWTFTVVLSFDSFRDLRSFEGQRQAFGKRPFHISCTRPLTPCGASASKCNCKSNKYLRKYKENLYYLRFLWITVVNVSSCSMEMYKERGNEFGQNGELCYIPQCGTYVHHCGMYIRHCGTYIPQCGI